jgi:hypothetical protein
MSQLSELTCEIHPFLLAYDISENQVWAAYCPLEEGRAIFAGVLSSSEEALTLRQWKTRVAHTDAFMHTLIYSVSIYRVPTIFLGVG